MNIKKVLFPLVACIVGIAVALVITEIGLRIKGIGYGRSGHISDPYLHHVNPKNFSFTAHSPSGDFDPFLFKYNEHGFRQRESKDKQQMQYRLALLGDSYTLARELPYEKTFAGMLEAASNSKTRVYNFSVASYSPIHYLVQWKRIISQFKPTHVIVQLYINDISNDREMSKIAVFSENGELEAIPGPKNDWLKVIAMKSYVVRFIFKLFLQLQWRYSNRNTAEQKVIDGFIEINPKISETSLKYITQLFELVTDAGAAFALTVVPSKYRVRGGSYTPDDLEFSDKWKIWAKKHDISFIDLVTPFHAEKKQGKKLFFDHDIHFTEDGCAVVTTEIQKKFPELFTLNYTEKK